MHSHELCAIKVYALRVKGAEIESIGILSNVESVYNSVLIIDAIQQHKLLLSKHD